MDFNYSARAWNSIDIQNFPPSRLIVEAYLLMNLQTIENPAIEKMVVENQQKVKIVIHTPFNQHT